MLNAKDSSRVLMSKIASGHFFPAPTPLLTPLLTPLPTPTPWESSEGRDAVPKWGQERK